MFFHGYELDFLYLNVVGLSGNMVQGGIGPPPSRCKREGLPLAYWTDECR